jgi:hypothetical protein
VEGITVVFNFFVSEFYTTLLSGHFNKALMGRQSELTKKGEKHAGVLEDGHVCIPVTEEVSKCNKTPSREDSSYEGVEQMT